MKQVWLASNRRIWMLAAVVPIVLLAIGGAMILVNLRDFESEQVAFDGRLASILGIGGGISLLAVIALGMIAWMASRPRVAFDGRHVLFYVRLGAPAQIPIGDVECFLMGQGPALLPGEHHSKTETVTVVVRLRERAEEWSHGEAHPLLAAWCDGHITLRGTWCEPLSLAVISRLNRALHEASRAAKA